jgi:hypothetical protein
MMWIGSIYGILCISLRCIHAERGTVYGNIGGAREGLVAVAPDAYIHTYIHAYMHTCTYTCIALHTHMYIYTYRIQGAVRLLTAFPIIIAHRATVK